MTRKQLLAATGGIATLVGVLTLIPNTQTAARKSLASIEPDCAEENRGQAYYRIAGEFTYQLPEMYVCDGAGTWQLTTTAHTLETHASRDGKYRVELSDRTKEFRYEVFSTRLSDGLVKKVGKPTKDREDVTQGVLISSDSKRVIYVQQDTALMTDRKLWSAPIDGSFIGTEISQPMQPAGGVEPGFMLVQDGMFVAYQADVLIDEQYRWYVVPAGGGEIDTSGIFFDGFQGGSTSMWSGVVK